MQIRHSSIESQRFRHSKVKTAWIAILRTVNQEQKIPTMIFHPFQDSFLSKISFSVYFLTKLIENKLYSTIWEWINL